MSEHSDDFLPDYVLGLLEGEPQRSVAAHLRECPRCAARLEELGGAIAPSPNEERSTPPPVATLPKLRLVAADGRGRFRSFAGPVSKLFDLRIRRAEALLELIDDPSCWVPGPAAGIGVFPVEAGPQVDGAANSIVRAAPGTRLPFHEHRGDEHTLVLQGGLIESTGRQLRRGEAASSAPGSGHWVEALPGEECIACVSAMGGTKSEPD